MRVLCLATLLLTLAPFAVVQADPDGSVVGRMGPIRLRAGLVLECDASGQASDIDTKGRKLLLAKSCGPYVLGAPDLSGMDLRGANLAEAQFAGVSLKGADLRGALLDGADLTGAEMRGAKILGARYSSKTQFPAGAAGERLRAEMVPVVSTPWAFRSPGRMQGLDGRHLHDDRLNGDWSAAASLAGKTLSGMTLVAARLRAANLVGTKLNDSDLTGADLRDADLSGADLRGANLTGALLEGALLLGAQADDKTRWPDGFDVVAAGAGAPAAKKTQAALAALTKAGVLRAATAADLDGWREAAALPPDRFGRQFKPQPRFPLSRTWVLLKQADLGDGFAGPDIQGFILPAGVPLPLGMRKGGPLYRMADGTCRGPFCPIAAQTGEYSHSLGGIPSHAALKAAAPGCVIEIEPDAVIHAVVGYESRQPARFLDDGNRPGRVDVTVTETTRPVALFLASYEGVEWNVATVPGARVVGAYVAGYHRSALLGLPNSVPVVVNTYADRKEAPCAKMPGYNGSDWRREGAALDRVATAVFGSGADEVQSFRDNTAVTIGPAMGPGPLVRSKDRGDPDAVRTDWLPTGVEGLRALEGQHKIRRASQKELLAWVEGYEARTRRPLNLSGPAIAWVLTGATRLPGHPGGWDNIFILPKGAAMPND
ncbi:MAG TPA: pentapeptide repeat-containing protein, partial [Magnetospirillum sp.]|nr:pentapeptide repeat-containing protein [Magnetospirillum sp.]